MKVEISKVGKKIYAVSTTALLDGNITSRVSAIRAWNKNEATGIALEYSKETIFPVKEGWWGHQVSVLEIPTSWMKQSLDVE